MAKKRLRAALQHVAVRLPATLVENVDELVEEMRLLTPGLHLSRSDLLRVLIQEALDTRSQARRRSSK
jgi:metal-responsive CopG/Arc/MetJ family transcriptional regulator